MTVSKRQAYRNFYAAAEARGISASIASAMIPDAEELRFFGLQGQDPLEVAKRSLEKNGDRIAHHFACEHAEKQRVLHRQKKANIRDAFLALQPVEVREAALAKAAKRAEKRKPHTGHVFA